MPANPLPLSVLVATVFATACQSPFLLLPGGRLEGHEVAAPESWDFTDRVDSAQLETNPGDPYSVNIWITAVEPALYVHSGTSRSRWVENLEADPAARLKIGESVYDLIASRVESQAEFDRFSVAYEEKYWRRPRNRNVGEAYLFRLDAPIPVGDDQDEGESWE